MMRRCEGIASLGNCSVSRILTAWYRVCLDGLLRWVDGWVWGIVMIVASMVA